MSDMEAEAQPTQHDGPTLHFPDGSYREVDSRTTLADIRCTYSTAFVVERDNPHKAHFSASFVLQNGCHYVLVLGEQPAQYLKRKLEELEEPKTEVPVTGEGEPQTKRAKSTFTLISDDKRMYLTSRCRINVPAVGPYNFDAAFVDLQEVSVAGLDTKYSPRFMRPSAKQLLPILGNPQHKICLVEGPPGTGKSSTVWAWACSISSACSVRWVHIPNLGGPALVDLEQSKIVRRAARYDLQTAIADCTCHILILDGIKHAKTEVLESAFDWLRQGDSRRLVIVSSLQLPIKLENIDYKKGKAFLMPSWTIEEYTEALQNHEFRNLVEANLGEGTDLDEKIRNKYFLAGGSARWMFDFSPKTLLKSIDRQITRVSDYSLLVKGLSGFRSEATINSLLTVGSDERCFPVSQYVTRRLACVCESSFLREAMKSTLIHNPAFNGWIFEGDFIFQLRMSEQSTDLMLKDFNANDNVSWGKAKKRIEFLKEELKNEDLKENTWLIPKRWNQGCYDAVQILADGVRFVQVTLSKRHDLKLRFIVQLLATDKRFHSKNRNCYGYTIYCDAHQVYHHKHWFPWRVSAAPTANRQCCVVWTAPYSLRHFSLLFCSSEIIFINSFITARVSLKS